MLSYAPVRAPPVLTCILQWPIFVITHVMCEVCDVIAILGIWEQGVCNDEVPYAGPASAKGTSPKRSCFRALGLRKPPTKKVLEP